MAAVACGGDSSRIAGEEQSAGASEQSILLGVLVPLSPPGAVGAGEAMRDAMTIAASELNQRGGVLNRRLELAFVDSEGVPERAVDALEELVSQHDVVAFTGGFHSSVGLAAKDVADENGIPIMFTDTWADEITSDLNRGVFRIGPLNSEVSVIDIEFIASLPDVSRVAIITENTEYGIPVARNTTDGLAEFGIEASTYTVEIGSQDFADVIDRVQADGPDMIVVYLTGEAGYRVQQMAADAGVGPQDLPFLCNQESMESKAFWASVPDGNYCFVRRVGVPEQLYNEVARDFTTRYKQVTGKQAAESCALAAYDSILILAQAIEEAGSTEAEAIISALEGTTYKGALGTITFPYNAMNTPAENDVEDKWWHQFPEPTITMIQYQEPGQNSADATIVFPARYKTADAVLVTSGPP